MDLRFRDRRGEVFCADAVSFGDGVYIDGLWLGVREGCVVGQVGPWLVWLECGHMN